MAGPVKVLVVDDDPLVLEIVRDWLASAGHDVATRGQALGTASWVANEKPNLVLLDVRMPALSGEELALLMRRSRATATTSVILHSSMPLEALDELAQRTGALGAIQKTQNSQLFLAEFDRLVAQHRSCGARGGAGS
ncbi:MAG TPA: response regulator [Polyangiaceae bacterium]